MKPPYIKLFIKDLVYDIQGMSEKEVGRFVIQLILSYKTGEIPEKFSDFSAFLQLKTAFEKYSELCQKNKQNRIKSTSYADQWSKNGKGLVAKKMTTLVKPEPEPEPEPERIPPTPLKKETVDIPDWLDSSIWKNFIDHRRSMKKPLTPHAQKLAFSKLDEFRKAGHNPVEIINQSILNGWQGLFAPKANNQNQHYSQKPTYSDTIRKAAEIALGNIERTNCNEIP